MTATCRNCGRDSDHHDKAYCKSVHLGGIPRPPPKPPHPMTLPKVDVSVPMIGGSMRLLSFCNGREELSVHMRHDPGIILTRLTPSQARTLSDVLRIYADSHRDTPDE